MRLGAGAAGPRPPPNSDDMISPNGLPAAVFGGGIAKYRVAISLKACAIMDIDVKRIINRRTLVERTHPSDLWESKWSTFALIGPAKTHPAFPGHLALVALCPLTCHDRELRKVHQLFGCHEYLIAITNGDGGGVRHDGGR